MTVYLHDQADMSEARKQDLQWLRDHQFIGINELCIDTNTPPKEQRLIIGHILGHDVVLTPDDPSRLTPALEGAMITARRHGMTVTPFRAFLKHYSLPPVTTGATAAAPPQVGQMAVVP